MIYIKLFNEISKSDVKLVGGKAASLGELTKIKMPVPKGFVLTTKCYEDFRELKLTDKLHKEIMKRFSELNTDLVAVRSSAIFEDSLSASWAGQLETFLNTKKEDLIENIRKCWQSIHSERALAYAVDKDLREDQLKVAVVVQKMVESESSGVIFTVNPITKNENEIMIEAGYGLGEMLVQGMITPDNFIVDKRTLKIKSKEINPQETQLAYKDGKNKEIPVNRKLRDLPAISDGQVKKLAKLAIRIEQHYGMPQDIEWALGDGGIYIVQSRPITSLQT